MTKAEVERIVEAKIRDEFRRMFGGIEERDKPRARRGEGRKMVRRSVSVPPELWERIENLKGSASSHVVNALEMYVAMIENS